MGSSPPTIKVTCTYPENVSREIGLSEIDQNFEIRPAVAIPRDETKFRYGPNRSLLYDPQRGIRRQPEVARWIREHPLRALLGKKALRDFDKNIERLVRIDGADRLLDGSFSGKSLDSEGWALILSGVYQKFCVEEIIEPELPPEKPIRIDRPLDPSRPISLSPFDYLSQYFSCWDWTSSLFLVGALALFALVRFQRRLPFELVGVMERHSTGEKLTSLLGRLRRREVNELIGLTRWIDAKPARIEGRQLIIEMPHYREIRRELWYRLDQAIFRGNSREVRRWKGELFEIDRLFGTRSLREPAGSWAEAAGRDFQAAAQRRLAGKIAIFNDERETLTSVLPFKQLRAPEAAREAEVVRIIRRRLAVAEENWARQRVADSPDLATDFAFFVEPDRIRIMDSGRRIEVSLGEETTQMRRLFEWAEGCGVGYMRSNLGSFDRHRALLALVRRSDQPWNLFQLPLLNGTYRIPSSFQLMIEELLKRRPPRDRVASIELRQILMELWEKYLRRETASHQPTEVLKGMTDWVVQVPEPFL